MGLKTNLNGARSTAQGLQSDLQGVAQAAEQAGGAIGSGFGGLPGQNRFGGGIGQGRGGIGQGRFGQGPTGPRGGSNRGGIIGGSGEGVRTTNDSPGLGSGLVVIQDPRGRAVLERLGPQRGNEFLGGQQVRQDLARAAKGIEELVRSQRLGGTLFRAGGR